MSLFLVIFISVTVLCGPYSLFRLMFPLLEIFFIVFVLRGPCFAVTVSKEDASSSAASGLVLIHFPSYPCFCVLLCPSALGRHTKRWFEFCQFSVFFIPDFSLTFLCTSSILPDLSEPVLAVSVSIIIFTMAPNDFSCCASFMPVSSFYFCVSLVLFHIWSRIISPSFQYIFSIFLRSCLQCFPSFCYRDRQV